jgi:hypothetical protein
MCELYDLVASPIDDGDESRAYGNDCLFRILWTPGCVKRRERFVVELNSKNLREFFDTKRPNRHYETLEESLCIFSFLLIDTQKCAAVCFVQRLRQVVQNPPNTRRESATQPINLADNPAEPTRSCESIGKPRLRQGTRGLTFRRLCQITHQRQVACPPRSISACSGLNK